LFNLISGRFGSTSGDITLHGQKLDGLTPYEINRRGLARSFQVSNLFTRLSVFENLRCAVLWSLGYGYTFVRLLGSLPNATARIDALMERVGLTAQAQTTAAHLPYAQQRALDEDYFGEGLTAVGDRVLTLTWKGGKGFIWDPETLEPEGEFAYAGEGWGLTHDATRLILSDGTAALRFLDPVTLQETGRVPVTLQGRPISQINELEWIEGEVFANVWQTDYIVRINPASGEIIGIIDLTELMPDRSGLDPTDAVLTGIAWDPEGRRLFVTGKNWPKLFEIRLTGPR
jgi:glutamine cyclotransferase